MIKKVSIFCKNTNSYKDYPIGTTMEEILKDQNIENKERIVSTQVNNKSKSLTFAVYRPKTVKFIDISTPSGMRTYVRTLSMVMSKAIYDLYPKAELHIEHPLSKGYYCNIKNIDKDEISEEMIAAIKNKMNEIIAKDIPIISHEKQSEEVIHLFKEREENDRVLLLQTLNNNYSEYYELDGYIDYYNGPLLPKTGKLYLFDIKKYHHGLLLQIPSRSNPEILEDFIDQPKMYEIFKENIEFGSIIGINNVGELNSIIKKKKIFDLIKIAEALHEKKIVRITDSICKNIDKVRFVMISGPSSSGKTTFSKRLSIQLMAAGIKPIVISLDNYFVNREETPVDENGEYDFESIQALDIDFFNQQLNQLLAGEKVKLPTFNFETGKRTFKGDTVQMKQNNIILMEGIHALNPALTPTIPSSAKFNIYVSALTTISLDNHNWIPTTDNRLLRRIVRDYRYRGYSAQETINRWQSVRKGENKWIFPYQENADVMFNSALIFELAALKKYVEPILSEVPKNSDEYNEANRLLKFLRFFLPIQDREMPSTSLLREFVGGSSFKY